MARSGTLMHVSEERPQVAFRVEEAPSGESTVISPFGPLVREVERSQRERSKLLAELLADLDQEFGPLTDEDRREASKAWSD